MKKDGNFNLLNHRLSWARWPYAIMLQACDWVVPKSNRMVLTTFPDGDDQGVALCLALQRAGSKVRVDWLFDDEFAGSDNWKQKRGLNALDLHFTKRYSLRGFWSFLRARWVFYTHGLYFSYPPPAGKSVVNLWHGMPIKKIWQGVVGANIPPQASLLCSTSHFYSGVLKRASGFRWNQLLESGLPRNDLLINPRSAVIEIVRRLRGEAERLILFLPTYRQSKVGFITLDGEETGQLLGLGDGDAGRLHTWLKANRCKLLVKPHPMSVMAGSMFTDDEHWAMIDDIRLRDEGIGLYELLSQADLLITDISSIYVDFLATLRPQIFFFPDQEKYKNSRGMLLDPLEDYLPGPLTSDYAQLQDALDLWVGGKDHWADKRKSLQALLIPPQSQPAAEQILARVGVLKPAPAADKSSRLARLPVAVFTWAQYGPYHFARLRALSKHMDVVRVLGVEIGSKSSTYSWVRDYPAKDLHTLCPGHSAEKASLLRIYLEALKYFSDEEADVVFVPSYWPASSLALILAARNAGAKVIMMNESHAHTAKAHGIWAEIKRRLVLQFDSAFVGGTPHKEYFASLGMKPEKIVLGYDAVDNDFFTTAAAQARLQAHALRARHGLPQRYFLNVGRMVWKKNIETLIDAYMEVRARVGADCPRLVLVGSGKLEKSLQERCLAAGLSFFKSGQAGSDGKHGDADVFFFGFRQAEELPGFYALASAFILPSQEEEWGLVVNEAMACGLPVLVSSVAGCAQDLVRDGENGFLFDRFDVNALAGHMEKIARDPGLTSTMGEASRRIIAEWGCDRFARAACEATEIAMKKT